MARAAGSATRDAETRRTRRIARKQQRQAERRAALLEAARKALAERGFEGFSLSAVAAEAGCSKASVLYYFETREQIVLALAAEIKRREVEALRSAVEAQTTGVDALIALVRAYVEHYLDRLDDFRVVYLWTQLVGSAESRFATDVEAGVTALNDRLEAKLVSDAGRGRLHPEARPRHLANVAWLTGHGLLSLLAGLERHGIPTRLGVDALLEEACATLRRAAEVEPAPAGKLAV